MHRLLSPFKEFALSSSGQVSPANGMAKGVLLAGLAAGAALIGAATQADADSCYGIPEGEDGWRCEPSCHGCNTPPPLPQKYWETKYYHSGALGCQLVDVRCVDACC